MHFITFTFTKSTLTNIASVLRSSLRLQMNWFSGASNFRNNWLHIRKKYNQSDQA